MTPPLPAARVAALLKTPKPTPQSAAKRAPRPRKFDRLANFGTRARKVLTDAEVRDIRTRWEAGEKLDSIAHDYGVTMACVSMIGTRQRRREVL